MISVKHLTKCYGEFTAVDDLSFEIDEGHVYGFLGPNGAGKSTTMNIITGCLSATSGQVTIDGHDIFEEPKEAKRAIGYLPEIPPLYTNETPEEYLKFVAEAKGLKGKEMDRQIEGVISQTRIQNVRKRLISKLSKGYRQRVGIAQALLGNPKVIILDEPTVGLDPIQIIEIRDLIKQLGKNHTVILSSHILSEVQAICEKVLIISGGKLIAFDEPEHLEKSLAGSNEILFTTEATREEVEEVKSLLGEITEVSYRETQDGLLSVTMKTDSDDIRGISRKLSMEFAKREKALYELTSKKANLEDIFLELTDYVFGAFLLVFVGIGSMLYNIQQAVANFEYVLGFISLIFVGLVPILTMRVLAEERKQRTDQLLYSLPITTTDIILGKYLALLVVFLIPLVIVAFYPLIFAKFGDVYLLTSYGSLIAFFIMGAALIAIGMFISSLTENLGMAAGICVAVVLFNYYSVSLADYISSSVIGSIIALVVLILIVGLIIKILTKNDAVAAGVGAVLLIAVAVIYFAKKSVFEGLLPNIMKTLSLFERFYTFVNGVFDMTAIVFYLSVIVFFLFLCVQSLEKRRYN